MHIFKTFFKISKKYIFSFFLYTGIFMTIAITMANQDNDKSVESFKSTKLDMTIFDHDNTSLSKGLYKYLAEKNNIIEIEEDIDTFRDSMYKREADYILIIPKGFEESVNNGEADILETYKSPVSIAIEFADMQINKFISTYSAYKETSLTDEAAYENTLKTLETETETKIYSETKSSLPTIHYFYIYIPYIFISIILMTVSPILMIFNKTEVKKRNLCSCVTSTHYNISIGLAALVFSLMVFAIYAVISIIMAKDDMLAATGALRLLNAFIFTLVSLSIGYLIAQITTKVSLASMYANIIGLGSSFLCGIFVPREYLGDSVLSVGKFLPAYWYVNVEEEILNYQGSISDRMLTGYGVQILFALVIFILGLVVYKLKKTK